MNMHKIVKRCVPMLLLTLCIVLSLDAVLSQAASAQ